MGALEFSLDSQFKEGFGMTLVLVININVVGVLVVFCKVMSIYERHQLSNFANIACILVKSCIHRSGYY